MSICKLRGLNVRLFYRQAFILANPTRYLPGCGYTARFAHNSLYQMVKKRTLEARTKLQPNKFPNNQPCVTPKSHSKSTNISAPPSTASKTPTPSSPAANPRPPPSTPPSSSSSSCPPKSLPPAPSPPPPSSPSSPKLYTTVPIKCSPKSPPAAKLDHSDKGERPKSKTSYNTQVLSVAQCNTKQKPCGDVGGGSSGGPDKSRCTGSTGSGGSGGSSGGAGKKDKCADAGASMSTKTWLAILAALGAGGLLAWLLTRGDKKDSDCPKSDAVNVPQTVPASSMVLPTHVPYLLIGGGTASFSAFRAIKSNDAKAKVLMISNEHRKPYMRPPLSKELWYSAQQVELTNDYRFKQWTGAERSLFFEPEEFFIDPTKLIESANGGIAVAQGFTVRKIDPVKQVVTLTDGFEIGYDECLIATGCSPKNLDVFTEAPASVREKVMLYRTPEDFKRLKTYVDEKKTITIVGNGFIGSELACSLASYAKEKNVKIYQAFPEAGVMSKVLPDYLSRWTTRKVEEQGVCVLANAGVKAAQRDNAMLKVTLNNGTTLLSDLVVVCVGCEANTGLAHLSGLEVDRGLGGFVVNAELEARSNLYVAGDAACFYDPLLGRRRVEHHDHSVVSGRLAGENMVGNKKAYTHQSMFWSDLGPEIGYEGIGLVDASLPTVAVFAAPSKSERNTDNLTETRTEATNAECLPDKGEIKCDDKDADNYGRGVIFYLKDDKIVGILLWNLFNRIGLARTIINQNKKFNDLNEVAKLFEIHA